MYYLVSLVTIALLLYTYRYRVCFWTIQLFIKTIQLYQRFKNRNVINNHLQVVTVENLSDNVVVCHYHGYVEQKEHKLKVIKNALDLSNKSDVMESLESRNQYGVDHIVHCTLTKSDETKMLDLTSMFREFVYHFDKDDDLSKIEHFVQYVSKVYDIEEVLDDDKNNLYFVIYLNDKNFTEVKYKVRELTNQKFKDVLKSRTKD